MDKLKLKINNIYWIWIDNSSDVFENIQWQRSTPEIKRKAIFDGKIFITRYNKNILNDGEIYKLSEIYKIEE